MQLRPTWRGYVGHCLVLAMVACIIFGPLTASAQAVNHAPVINSKPATTIQAGAVYAYTVTAFDSDNDAVTFKLTTQPDGMTLTNATLDWHPTKIGTYNVVVQATDGKNGYDSQAWQITVSVGDVASVVISPNDRPTVVAIGQSKQFTVFVADAYENTITNQTVTWTTDSAIGSITAAGLFTPTHGGTGFVAAQVGTVKASVGVVAKDSRTDQISLSNTNTSTNSNTNGTAASVVNNVNKKTPTNSNSHATTDTTNEVMSVDTNTNTNAESTKSTDTSQCTNPNHKLIISILIVYAIILVVYYSYERRHKNSGWWIFPFLLTFIGVIIYYKYICADTYLWWPWALVIIGVILTLYYKLRRQAPDINQTELPF